MFFRLVNQDLHLSYIILDFLVSKLKEAKEDREKRFYPASDQEIESAISVLSNYLYPRMKQRITDLEKSLDSLTISINKDQTDRQRITAESDKSMKTIEKMDPYFANDRGLMAPLGYDCPHCRASILLSRTNTKGSIKVTCGNCKKTSTPSLLEFYQNVLKHE